MLNRNLRISIAVLAVSRALTFLAFPHPTIQPDSSTYVPSSWLDFDLVSLTGNAARGWPVSLIYALSPNDMARELLQLAFSLFCWAFLIYAATSLLHSKSVRNASFIALTILGSSPAVLQWDTVMLPTSFLVSCSILLVASVIVLKIDIKSRIGVIALIFSFGLLAFQKSSNIPYLIVIAVLLLFVFRSKSRRFVFSSIAGLLILISGASIVGGNVNDEWPGTYSGQALLWQLGEQSPASGQFAAYLSEKGDAPRCIFAQAPFASLDIEIGKIMSDCPDGVKYLRSSIQSDFMKFVLSNPVVAIKLISVGFGASVTTTASHYGSAVSIFPQFASSIFFGESTPDFRFTGSTDQISATRIFLKGEPLWLIAPFFAWLLAGLVSLFILRRSARGLALILFTLITANLFEMALMFVLLPSEWVRQSSLTLIPIQALSVLAICLAVENRFFRRGGPESNEEVRPVSFS